MGESLGEALPKEQARVRQVLLEYRRLGSDEFTGAGAIEVVLRKADTAIIDGDLIAMIASYGELKGIK